jgi:CDP-diacylglycerol---glycerol-3-phosphate 3-phosphatidyltransferase
MTPIEQHPYSSAGGGTEAKPNPGFQRFTDGAVSAVFLWMFPRSVRPNHLTYVRFILIPVVLVLLANDLDWWGLAVFVVATMTDFIDGAMARKRDQITVLGTYIDPMADKLLVAAVLAFVAYTYGIVLAWVMVGFIGVELVATAFYTPILIRMRSVRPANTYGKAKMIFQSIALYLFLLGGILGLQGWMTVGWYLLWPALLLAVISGSKQIHGAWKMSRQQGPSNASRPPASSL